MTELRVHGISGAPAEDMLDRPVVTRVAGDEHAGFYRPRPGFGDATGPGGVTLEAYRWGNLTTGTAARTLSFLLLLPFMLSNVAIWMRPAGPGRGTAVPALCRVLAATVTAMFVLSIVGASVDLVGWQCAGYPACTSGREYLSWLAPIPPGHRLVLLCAAPIAAIWLVWWLGARSARAYEAFRYGVERTGGQERLDDAGFWDRERQLVRLRSIHVAIAFGVLDLSLLAGFASSARRSLALALLVLVGALLVTCLAVLWAPVPSGRQAGRGWNRAARAIRAAALALTVVTLGYTLVSSPEAAAGHLPGFEPVVTGLFVGQTVLLATLTIVALRHRSRPADRWPLLHPMGAPLFSSAAVGVGAAFSAALLYRVADVLDRGAIPSPARPVPAGAPPLQPPIAYRWAALGGVAAVLVAAIIGVLWNLVSRPRLVREAAEVARRDFPRAPPEARPRLQAVRDVVVRSRMPEQLGPLLLGYLVLSLLSLAAAGLELVDLGPIELERRLGAWATPLVRLTSLLTDVGTYLIGLFAIGLVVVATFTYRSPDLRRLVGVLWDLGTFWPRVAHPFAPPCYAERAVPELTRRIHALTRQGPVLVAGHSHGSVLVAAALLQLPPEALARIGLLTSGSPLRRLYALLTPAYFGEDVLKELGERVAWRWRNLWRDTDPIGGPVFSPHRPGEPARAAGPAGAVDRRLRDPLDVTIEPMDTVPPPIKRHWPYHTDPHHDATVAEIARMLQPR